MDRPSVLPSATGRPALLAGVLAVLSANLWLPWTFARLWADLYLFVAWPLLWG